MTIAKTDNQLTGWLKAKLAGKNIPFDIFNFTTSPDDWAEYEKVEVAGLQLPKLNELTQAERIVLDSVENDSLSNTLKLQLKLKELAKGLEQQWTQIVDEIAGELDKDAAGLATSTVSEEDKVNAKEKRAALKEKRAALSNLNELKPVQLSGLILPADTLEYRLVSATIGYQEFQSDNMDAIGQLYILLQDLGDRTFTDLVKVGFFLASRVSESWADLGKLGRLPESKAKAILKFVATEINGGVEPNAEPVSDDEPVAAGK